MTVIRTEYGKLKDGRKLTRIYSDLGLKLIQLPTGVFYDDAIDIEGSTYVYGESKIPVNPKPEETS